MAIKFAKAGKGVAEKIKKEFKEEYMNYLHFDDGFTIIALDKNKIIGSVCLHILKNYN